MTSRRKEAFIYEPKPIKGGGGHVVLL